MGIYVSNSDCSCINTRFGRLHPKPPQLQRCRRRVHSVCARRRSRGLSGPAAREICTPLFRLGSCNVMMVAFTRPSICPSIRWTCGFSLAPC